MWVQHINAIDFDALPSMVAEIPVRFVNEIKYFVMFSSLSWDKGQQDKEK